ncbi:WD40 repeat domain-containing protein, partial [Streptomyces griseorubiginosus]|uniref:WD40 repeat domain-containing protein n=1 Tax=Streptomyces griseorubiginosus TaxID=67304 RepID=UPI003452EC31
GHTKGVSSVTFSPNGDILATASDDGTARLWNIATGHLLHTLIGHTKGVSSVTFSPNGDILATASDDGTARLWNVTAPKPDSAIASICQAVGRDLTMRERADYLLKSSPSSVCHF